MGSSVIAGIDPGKHGCGMSIFKDEVLVHAQYTSGLGGEPDPLLEIRQPLSDVLHDVVTVVGQIDTLVLEQPQVYDNQKQVGRQRDIVELAIVVGVILREIRGLTRSVVRVEPARWKGQAPKDVMCERIQGKLSPDETKAVELPKATSLHHNVWDGIGLGLWRLQRLGK